MELLKQLYGIHSPSNNEKEMQLFLTDYLRTIKGVETFTDKSGNIYAVKGKAKYYPCIVAHIDQVQRIHEKDFVAVETDELIFGYSPHTRQFNGLGADDKNGVWCALQLLNTTKNIKCAFFVGEEIGCIGSWDCDIDFFNDCGYILQADRRGYGDLITSIGGDICSQDFIDTITPSLFGYSPTSGLMTDVETLKNRGVMASCVNISCGYYEPHTDNEYTIKKDLLNCLAFMQHIISTCGENLFAFDCQKYFGEYGHYNGFYHDDKNYRNMYDDGYNTQYWNATDEMEETILECPTMQFNDFYDYFADNYPLLSFEDLTDIFQMVKKD